MGELKSGSCKRCKGSGHIPVCYPIPELRDGAYDGFNWEWEWEGCPDCQGTGTPIEPKSAGK